MGLEVEDEEFPPLGLGYPPTVATGPSGRAHERPPLDPGKEARLS